MLDEPVTTWLLVMISPVGLMSMPVPEAWPLPSVVLMSTIAGITRAAIALALVLPFDEPVPGVTWVIGDSGWLVAWPTWWPLIVRARVNPMPAPAAAATMAIRTRNAATRLQKLSRAGGGGGGAHTGGGGADSGDGGSRLRSRSPGFISDIDNNLRLPWYFELGSSFAPAPVKSLFEFLEIPQISAANAEGLFEATTDEGWSFPYLAPWSALSSAERRPGGHRRTSRRRPRLDPGSRPRSSCRGVSTQCGRSWT